MISSSYANIARNTASVGLVEISGADSSWSVVDLNVGGNAYNQGGNATIDITDTGSISVTDDLILWDTSTIKIDLSAAAELSMNSSFAFFDVGDSATLDGDLVISSGGYTITLGDKFMLLAAGSLMDAEKKNASIIVVVEISGIEKLRPKSRSFFCYPAP